MKNFFKEFKKFISKGNILDLAIGMIMGSAFSAIVTSLVNDIIMPPIGVLIGGVDFKDLVVVIKEATDEAAAVTWNYGNFILTIINFIIIALCMFFVVKFMMSIKGFNKHEANHYKNVFTKAEIKAFKAEGKSVEDIQKLADEKYNTAKEAEAKANEEKAIKEKALSETNVLLDIRALLMEQVKQSGKNPEDFLTEDTKKYIDSQK